MDFSLEELNYILNTIDTHVRANGITGAAMGVSLANKCEAEAKNLMEAAKAEAPSDGE